MKDFYVCSTRYLKIDITGYDLDPLNLDFHFGISQLSNSNILLESLLANNLCYQKIGFNHLPPFDTPFFYENLENIPYENRIRIAEKKLETCESIIFNLWFIKDCSCNVREYFDVSYTKNDIFSRARTTVFCNSEAEYNYTSFNPDEIFEAANLEFKISKLIHTNIDEETIRNKPNQDIGEITSADGNYLKYSNTNRLYRAHLFLRLARSNSFLPLKISFYIGILETLFTTDNNEVTHKVSERISFYLKNELNKLETFKLIKECYGIRSKFVHGQKLDKKYDNVTLKLKSKEIDQIVRVLLNKIIKFDSDIFLKDDQVLNDYFTNLIFE